MKLLALVGLILLIISTMSVAQIRYALANPFTSLNTILGIVAEITFISYLGYKYLSGKNLNFRFNFNRSTNYSLAGTKGGKAAKTRRKKSNLNHHGKH
jgi:hypothetical protein